VTDTQDNSKPSDLTHRLDDLFTAIRGALTSEAAADARSAGAIAARAILGALEPLSARSATAPAPTSPITAALGAIGSIPREQLLAFVVGGLRSMLSQKPPTYHARPAPAPPRRADGEP
jgi:hypothetical protein